MQLEIQVTRKIEDSLAGLPGVKHITSNISGGASTTSIEFDLGTDTDRAVNDVRDTVSRVRSQLPRDVEEPAVRRLDITGGALTTYVVSSSERSVVELSWLVDNEISRALLAVSGVGQVQRAGGVEREIRVLLDPVKLEAVGVTADQVNVRIRELNINLPGGRGELAGEEQSIRTLGTAETLEQLRELRIPLPGGGWTRLEDLGVIVDATSEPRQRALFQGEPVVAFSIVRTSGSNLVEVQEHADEAIEKLEESLPPDISIQKIRSNAVFVEESYEATVEHLELGAGLAVVVIFLFLRDWKAAIISAVAMPMSIIPTFLAMQAAGFTLNNMSLLALALVIGILVDDAIVEVENIVRHIHMGKTPYQAALDGADEIGLAVVATTSTIIVVFVPVAFMGGIPGQFFKQFGLVVAVAVFFSLLVARLLTPMMAAYWMGVPPETTGKSLLMRGYDFLLQVAMENRPATCILAFLFFLFGVGTMSQVPTSLIAAVDRGETAIDLELPPSVQLDETTATVRAVTARLKARPEVRQVFTVIGTPSSGGLGGGSQGAVNKATLYVGLTEVEERDLSQAEFEREVREGLRDIPGVRIKFGSRGGISGKLTLMLASHDVEALERTSEVVEREMRELPGLGDVVSSAALLRPEIQIIPDGARAAEQGVSVQTIARTALLATVGDNDANLAKFNLPDRQINIRVQLDQESRDDLRALRSLRIPTLRGTLVPLGSVAEVRVGTGAAQISRIDRERQIQIEASLNPGTTLGQALKAVHALPSMKSLPESVHEQPAGDVEIQNDVFSGFAMAMGSAVLLIYCVLVLLFQDFFQPLTIMVSLPLSIGGAVLGLVSFGHPLGMYALIGIVMLMGLVTKNAILLVEHGLKLVEEGSERTEAIIEAGETRMRPILMTTVAMIAGMTPIAAGIGAGAEVRAPMALAVIGGLVSSTFLTLLVVPVVFTLVNDLRKKLLGSRIQVTP